MYLNKCGFRARVLNVPFQLLRSWIKKAGVSVENIASKLKSSEPRNIDILEMDELYNPNYV